MGCNHASGSADPVRVQSISSCSKAYKDSDISLHDGAHRPGTFLSTVAFCLSHFILTPKIRKFVFLLLRKELNTTSSTFSIYAYNHIYTCLAPLICKESHIYSGQTPVMCHDLCKRCYNRRTWCYTQEGGDSESKTILTNSLHPWIQQYNRLHYPILPFHGRKGKSLSLPLSGMLQACLVSHQELLLVSPKSPLQGSFPSASASSLLPTGIRSFG